VRVPSEALDERAEIAVEAPLSAKPSESVRDVRRVHAFTGNMVAVANRPQVALP
jgi:hypothetical protein